MSLGRAERRAGTGPLPALAWIDDERAVTAAADATLQAWCPDDAVPAAVDTVAAAGMTFVRERRTALIWSARGDLRAWVPGTGPGSALAPGSAVAEPAHFTRLAVSAVDSLLALVDAGSTEFVLVSDWQRGGQRSGRHQDPREREGTDAR